VKEDSKQVRRFNKNRALINKLIGRTLNQLTLLIIVSLPALSQIQVNLQESVTNPIDSIVIKKDGYFNKNGEEISYKELINKLKGLHDDSINFLLKKHDKRFRTASALAFSGGFIIGFTLSDEQFDTGEKTGLITVGVGALVISVIHGRSRFKLTNSAVERYNYLISKEY
jgi:hypothetical protein